MFTPISLQRSYVALFGSEKYTIAPFGPAAAMVIIGPEHVEHVVEDAAYVALVMHLAA
jgi:hypothetical protein